jgi:hypothetical protein
MSWIHSSLFLFTFWKFKWDIIEQLG